MGNDPGDLALFLDESRWENRSFAVHDNDGLAGFFTFDVVDDGTTVDVGLGMEPSRSSLSVWRRSNRRRTAASTSSSRCRDLLNDKRNRITSHVNACGLRPSA